MQDIRNHYEMDRTTRRGGPGVRAATRLTGSSPRLAFTPFRRLRVYGAKKRHPSYGGNSRAWVRLRTISLWLFSGGRA
jgi:hypothetical protein